MVYLADGTHIFVRQSIGSMEHLLSEHKFLRIHRSFIVSLSRIESYNAMAVKTASKELPIGRLCKQSVWEKLG
jgi:DNA-binding LytR/AlgR family response regulator